MASGAQTSPAHAVDVTELIRSFSDIHGHQPEGVWAAPGRVNLIGEHTDYNDGLVLPFALPHATYAAAARRYDGVVRVHSMNTGETVETSLLELAPGSVTGWAAYVAGVFWSLREAGYEVGGADLTIETSVPQGAGLSSSAALECSAALAAIDLHGHAVEPLALAKIAQQAENDFVGMPCGLMDQMVCMLGQAGHVVQFDNRSLDAEVAPFNAEAAKILVIDTKAPHQLVDGEYAARREQCELAAMQLGLESLRELNDADAPSLEEALDALDRDVLRRRVKHVVTENQRVLDTVAALVSGDLADVGRHMTASHASLRDDYEVTVPEVDLAQQTLEDGGAYGARITGGGFGGCVIGLVRSRDAGHLASQVRSAFAEAGYREPASFIADPADGARRVR